MARWHRRSIEPAGNGDALISYAVDDGLRHVAVVQGSARTQARFAPCEDPRRAPSVRFFIDGAEEHPGRVAAGHEIADRRLQRALVSRTYRLITSSSNSIGVTPSDFISWITFLCGFFGIVWDANNLGTN